MRWAVPALLIAVLSGCTIDSRPSESNHDAESIIAAAYDICLPVPVGNGAWQACMEREIAKLEGP